MCVWRGGITTASNGLGLTNSNRRVGTRGPPACRARRSPPRRTETDRHCDQLIRLGEPACPLLRMRTSEPLVLTFRGKVYNLLRLRRSGISFQPMGLVSSSASMPMPRVFERALWGCNSTLFPSDGIGLSTCCTEMWRRENPNPYRRRVRSATWLGSVPGRRLRGPYSRCAPAECRGVPGFLRRNARHSTRLGGDRLCPR